jgi:hypothetical protein
VPKRSSRERRLKSRFHTSLRDKLSNDSDARP